MRIERMYSGYFNRMAKEIGVAVMLLTLVSFAGSAKGKTKDDIFISAEISDKDPYQGEAVVLTYKLYSKTGDIGFAERVSPLNSATLPEASMTPLELDRRGMRENIDGETFFVFPLESYMLTPLEKGKVRVDGGGYEIGVKYPVVYDDPFWGRRRGYKTEKRTLPVPHLEFKVRALPTSPEGEVHSGTVGQFSIQTTVPPGEIILERPARAIVTIKGRGVIDEEALPNYKGAFEGRNVRLKSMSENRNIYFDGKSIVSELVLDCEFIPLDREASIGSMSFSFFNPEKGRYETTESAPVEVIVKSITTRIAPVEI